MFKGILFFSLILICNFTPAQDTLDYFPLKVSNYWEMFTRPPYPLMGYSYKIVGDTLCPNHKRYSIVRMEWFDSLHYSHDYYWRYDNNAVFEYYRVNTCADSEYKYFDFAIEDDVIWPICWHCYGQDFKVCDTTFNQFNYVFQKEVEVKDFQFVSIVNGDTQYSPTCFPWFLDISKEIGITREFIVNEGDFHLTGAIINGVKYGTIVGLKDEVIAPHKISLDVFPNPTNGAAKIKFTISQACHVKLSIYNTLGQKIKDLLNSYYPIGNHKYNFSNSQLASGIYILHLNTGNQNILKKLVFLK